MPKLTVTVKNVDNEKIQVLWHESKVRVKGGTWQALAKNTNTDTIAVGGTASTVHDALFGLDANRRYQIHLTNGDSDAVVYYPSSSTWTTDGTPTISGKV